MIIRPAREDDADAIQRLLDELGYSLDRKIVLEKVKNYSEHGYELLIGSIDDEVVGFIALHWFDIFHSAAPIGRITAMCVLAGRRGQAIGERLIRAAEKSMESRGCMIMEATCNVNRTLTHQFYIKQGYSENARRFIRGLSCHEDS